MKPYIITSTELITESGKVIPASYITGGVIVTIPLNKVKSIIIDSYAGMQDKIVDVKFKIKMVWKEKDSRPRVFAVVLAKICILSVLTDKNLIMKRNISDNTIISCLVSYKCLGYFGRSFTPLTKSERKYVVDELIKRGYLDENMNVLPSAKDIIEANLNLLKQ